MNKNPPIWFKSCFLILNSSSESKIKNFAYWNLKNPKPNYNHAEPKIKVNKRTSINLYAKKKKQLHLTRTKQFLKYLKLFFWRFLLKNFNNYLQKISIKNFLRSNKSCKSDTLTPWNYVFKNSLQEVKHCQTDLLDIINAL